MTDELLVSAPPLSLRYTTAARRERRREHLLEVLCVYSPPGHHFGKRLGVTPMPTVSAFLPSPEVSPLGYTFPRRAYSLLHPSGGILRASHEMWLGKEGAQPGPSGRMHPIH